MARSLRRYTLASVRALRHSPSACSEPSSFLVKRKGKKPPVGLAPSEEAARAARVVVPPPRQQRIVCALDGLGHSPERGIVASEHADGRYDGSDGSIFFLMHFSYKASILGCILVSYDGSDGSVGNGPDDRHLWAPPDRHGLPRRSPSACSEIVKKRRAPKKKRRARPAYTTAEGAEHWLACRHELRTWEQGP